MKTKVVNHMTQMNKDTKNLSRSQKYHSSSKPRSKWKRFLFGLLVFLLMTIGLGLVFHQSVANFVSQFYTRSYDHPTSRMIHTNQDVEGDFNPNNVKGLTSADMVGHNYTNLPVIGNIAIPDIGMNLPIFKGLANENLSVGAGTMKDNQVMGTGNYTLASHSIFEGYGSQKLLFTPLHRSKVGQKIYLRDDKYIYTYETTDVFEVTPDDGYVTNDPETDGEKWITLVTCTDLEATKRLIVRGKYLEQKAINEAPKELQDYFETKWTRWW